MAFINLEELAAREMIPGFSAKFIHTDSMTLSYWDIKKGATLPEHAHPHEQATNLLEGVFELTVDGEAKVLEPGMVATIAPNAKHSGKALTDCRILDVFFPVREDYK